MQTQTTAQAHNGVRNLAPGPKGHFLIGSIPEFKSDILQAIEDGRTAYGDLVRFKLGPKAVYAACSPELAEEVLVKQRDVFLAKWLRYPRRIAGVREHL